MFPEQNIDFKDLVSGKRYIFRIIIPNNNTNFEGNIIEKDKDKEKNENENTNNTNNNKKFKANFLDIINSTLRVTHHEEENNSNCIVTMPTNWIANIQICDENIINYDNSYEINYDILNNENGENIENHESMENNCNNYNIN